MGRRGPPKKPADLKKAEGTYQKCRDEGPAAAEQPAVGAPALPKGLKGAGLRRWNDIVPELLRIGTISVVDGGALERYCRTYHRWTELEKIALLSPTSESAVESRKLDKEVLQPLELALGLHYAARNRVKMPEKAKPEDPVEEELFGNQPVELTAIAGGKTGA